MNRRGRQRNIVDERRAAQPRPLQQGLDFIFTACSRCRFESLKKTRIGIEQAASIGDEQMLPQRGFEQVYLRHTRRRRAHATGGFLDTQLSSFPLVSFTGISARS